MKAEYYIINNQYCSYPLRKYIGACEYIWLDVVCKWHNMGTFNVWLDKDKKKITEEEAFRYILEH